jgi:hypothetical protein
MRAEGYGGSKDWRILAAVQVRKAGAFERRLSTFVKSVRVYKSYRKDGVAREAIELHRCSFSQARRAMMRLLKEFGKDPRA